MGRLALHEVADDVDAVADGRSVVVRDLVCTAVLQDGWTTR